MSLHDYPCALSGISLLGAQAALLLLEKVGETWAPASLPLFGIYDGQGILSDIGEGPNATLIFEGITRAFATGNASVDFDAMAMNEQPLDSLEMILGLVACSHMPRHDAFRVLGRPIGFALVSAHVLAEVMEGEPPLPVDVPVERLADLVFSGPVGRMLHEPVSRLDVRTRLKFGMSLAGLSCLAPMMERNAIHWESVPSGMTPEKSDPARLLAEATIRFSKDERMVLALEEYAAQFEGDSDVTS